MFDPTSYLPERLKEKLADSLVELLAGSAEQLGSEKIAASIRHYSSHADYRESIEQALATGIERFVQQYSNQDEDLVAAIQEDEIFWQSEAVQDALAELVKRPGSLLGEERETVLRHFEMILPARRNRERVDKAVSFLLRCIAEEVWSLPGAQEIREIYSVQFQKLSAEAQREQLALSRQQLAVTTQLSADLQGTLLQLMTLVEQKALAAPPPVAALPSPRPYNNLPQPTYTQFIGRDEELAWLRERLSPADRAWQIAVTGIGGVGKSALALAIAHEYRERYSELPSEERFEAIVWVSAKEEVLTAFGRERADVPEQVLHTLEDVYTAIARVLEREDITRAQPGEQNALVRKALQRQRVMLIMDNLESVKDDRIKAFLRNLPPPTKAIITSRESLDVADIKPLTGLSPEEADELIAEEARERKVALTLQQRKRVFDLTWGLPLPIKLAVARMAGGESVAAVERWLGDAVGELPEYCVKGQIELVRKQNLHAWPVLFACSLFDREAGASREALGEIADLSLLDRDAALGDLQRLFLVNRTDEDRFWVLPIVQRYASTKSPQDFPTEATIERWLTWLMGFATARGHRSESEPEQMRQIGEEYPNLRSAIYWCRDHQLFEMLLALCDSTWHYPYRFALFGDVEEIVNAWLAAARHVGGTRAQGHALLQKGRLHWIQGRPNEALVCLDGAEELLEETTDYADLAEAWETRASIYDRSSMLEECTTLGHRVVDLGQRYESTDVILLGMHRVAITESRLVLQL